jgi:hypothetical protein
MDAALTHTCNWLASHPWSVAVLVSASILIVGACEVPV